MLIIIRHLIFNNIIPSLIPVYSSNSIIGHSVTAIIIVPFLLETFCTFRHDLDHSGILPDIWPKQEIRAKWVGFRLIYKLYQLD